MSLAQRIPVRWIVACFSFYACAIISLQRANVSVSIVHMTSPKLVVSNLTRVPRSQTSELSDECYPDQLKFDRNQTLQTLEVSQVGEPEFDWNEELQGIILGASFYLYCIVPAFAGRLTDAFGGKWVCFAGVSCSALISLLTPPAVALAGSTALIVLQIFLGAFLAFIYPSIYNLLVRWFPANEKANANAGMIFGGCVGTSLGSYMAGELCNSRFGWPSVFYASALVHLPLLLAWLLMVTNDPLHNRWISDRELTYILDGRSKTSQPSKKRQVPWSRILTSVPVWTSMLTKMGMGFGGFFLLSKTPSYLATVYGLSIKDNGEMNAIIGAIGIIATLLAAPISGLVIKHTNLSSIMVRKIFQSISSIGPSLCLALVPFQNCNLPVVLVLLNIATFLFQFRTAGEWTIISYFAPNNSGLVLGLAVVLSFSMGFVAPLLAGVILNERSGRHEWNIIFYIASASYFTSSMVFNIFATDKQQDWDKLDEEDETEKGKQNEDKEGSST